MTAGRQRISNAALTRATNEIFIFKRVQTNEIEIKKYLHWAKRKRQVNKDCKLIPANTNQLPASNKQGLVTR